MLKCINFVYLLDVSDKMFVMWGGGGQKGGGGGGENGLGNGGSKRPGIIF